MQSAQKNAISWLWIGLWCLVAVAFVLALPGYGQYDATRYFQIAHEMWTTQQYLVPHWQGQLYSDKPPLLFWLYIAGWKIFGVNRWWPQLLVVLFASGTIVLTKAIAKQLWSDRPLIADLVPYVLIALFGWLWFADQIRVDAILTFATVLAVYGLLVAQRQPHGWWIYGLAIGLGILAKGPVIFIFVLFPALLMPIWSAAPIKKMHWYGLLLWMTVLGVGMALLWAIPAAIVGGQQYAHAIFYGQIQKRSHHWGHPTSHWFYLQRLFFWLLPWTLFLPMWRGLFRKTPFATDQFAIKICLNIIIPALIVFSLFSQKLPHYMYPLLPFFALFMAWGISNVDLLKISRASQWLLAALFVVVGLLGVSFPYWVGRLSMQLQVRTLFLTGHAVHLWSVLFLLVGLVLLVARFKTISQQVVAITIAMLVTVVVTESVILKIYQNYRHANVVIEQLQTAKQRPVVVMGQITNVALKAYLKTRALIKFDQRGLATHPNIWFLTTSDCWIGRYQPRAWFYQSRYSVVSLWRHRPC